MSDAILARYRDIIPEAHTWQQRVGLPLPQCAWVNTLKINFSDLTHFLKKENMIIEPMRWNSQGFRYQTSKSLGRHWTYLAGLLQIQEEISMLPVKILNPQMNDCVLDLCAAPGNKTAEIAVAMKNHGIIFTNDNNYQRLRATGQIIKRLGLININLTVYDGCQYPEMDACFDKILVDAPCSCEGTFRKSRVRPIVPNVKNSRRMSQLQLQLLKKAFALCKPGGLICYSTCTFAPEENEAVIDALLKYYSGKIEVCQIEVPHLICSPGVTHWQGQSFCEKLSRTIRIWPHLNNTGGFYVALLRKTGSSEINHAPCRPVTINNNIQQHLQTVSDRFAIPMSIFQKFRFNDQASARGIYATNLENNLEFFPDLQKIKMDCQGLFFLKTRIKFPKLSTAAAMLLGNYAKKNVVILTDDQLIQFMQQETFTLKPSQTINCADTGYVMVGYNGQWLGLGIYFSARDQLAPRLRSLFPTYLQ